MKMKKISQIDEGVGDYIRISVLASMLAVPGFLSAKDITAELKDKPTYTQFETILKEKDTKKYDGWTQAQIINVVARTLFAEARGEGQQGINYVASVIYNRAGGNRNKLAYEALLEEQFSCWNGLNKSERLAKNWKITVPKKAFGEQTIWTYCVSVATEMFNEDFHSIDLKLNSYYNPKKANPSWRKDLKSIIDINNHKFGYLQERDGYRKYNKDNTVYYAVNGKPKQNTNTNKKSIEYKIKSGDTLSDIAKKHKTTVKDIQKKNPNIKDINKIKPGQTIKI